MFNSKYNRFLSQLFSRSALLELAESNTIELATHLISKSGLKEYFSKRTWAVFFDTAYKHLRLNYRSEYVFKNTIANKILLGRHSLNTATLQSELRAANCKADTVIFNGTSTAYEIKSDYDSYDRLERQLAAYRKLFDQIFVVVSVNKSSLALDLIPQDIGIIALTNTDALSVKRKSASHIQGLDTGLMFDSLRKEEYLPIVEEITGEQVVCPNTQAYTYCREIFQRLSNEQAHDYFVSRMRKRCPATLTRELTASAPWGLRGALLSSNLNSRKAFMLAQALPQPVR